MSVLEAAAALFNIAALALDGIEVTYTPSGGSAVTIKGLLDTGPVAQAREQGIYGTLWIRLADLATPPKKGDGITIDGVDYRVAKDPLDTRDGVGGTYLYLKAR